MYSVLLADRSKSEAVLLSIGGSWRLTNNRCRSKLIAIIFDRGRHTRNQSVDGSCLFSNSGHEYKAGALTGCACPSNIICYSKISSEAFLLGNEDNEPRPRDFFDYNFGSCSGG